MRNNNCVECKVVKHAAILDLSPCLSKNNIEKWWMAEVLPLPPMCIIVSYLWLHDNTTWEQPARAATFRVSPSSSTWRTNMQETVSSVRWNAALHLHSCTRFSCVKAKMQVKLLPIEFLTQSVLHLYGATDLVKPALKFENGDKRDISIVFQGLKKCECVNTTLSFLLSTFLQSPLATNFLYLKSNSNDFHS